MHLISFAPLITIVILAYALQVVEDYVLHLWYSTGDEVDEHETNSI